MYVEKGIPSILRGKKVIVAGDQKQLRPSSLGSGRTEIDLDELDEEKRSSLIELIEDDEVKEDILNISETRLNMFKILLMLDT